MAIVKTGPAAMSTEVKYPELLGCIRAWHGGHAQRTKEGERILLPWRTIELTYGETSETICAIDVEKDEDDDVLNQTIEHKIHMYCKPRARGDSQIVDVKCHFNDGQYTYDETCTVAVDLPPNRPAYGHTGYAGMGKDLAQPNTQLAVQLKGNIDLTHATMGILREALGTLKQVVSDQRGELSDRRAHESEMFAGQVAMIKAVREVMDWKVEEELKREFHKYKIYALHAAFEKAMKFGPPVLMRLARQVGYRLEGVDTKTPVPPHEKRAFLVLKDMIQEMAKRGTVGNMGMLLEGLKSAGVDPSTVDRLTDVLQEAQVAAMTDAMEEESAAGIGDIFDGAGNLRIPGIQSNFANQKAEAT